MNRWRKRLMWGLMILAASLLPGADVECDCEDGEFEFSWPSIEFDDCDDCWDDDWDDDWDDGCDGCWGCDHCRGGDDYFEFDFWDYFW